MFHADGGFGQCVACISCNDALSCHVSAVVLLIAEARALEEFRNRAKLVQHSHVVSVRSMCLLVTAAMLPAAFKPC